MHLLASLPLILAQTADDTGSTVQTQQLSPATTTGLMVADLVIAVLLIAALWKVFTKAGLPGWGAIIPVYNFYLLCKAAGKPGWWLILFFIPLVNFVIAILVYAGLAKNFGKGAGFVLGLIFLPFIFLPILGFGSARYLGNAEVPPLTGGTTPYPTT